MRATIYSLTSKTIDEPFDRQLLSTEATRPRIRMRTSTHLPLFSTLLSGAVRLVCVLYVQVSATSRVTASEVPDVNMVP